MCAALAGFFFGAASYSYGSNFSKYGLFGTGAMGPFTLLFVVSIKACFAVKYRFTTGRWLKESDSILVRDEPPRNLKWTNLRPPFG